MTYYKIINKITGETMSSHLTENEVNEEMGRSLKWGLPYIQMEDK